MKRILGKLKAIPFLQCMEKYCAKCCVCLFNKKNKNKTNIFLLYLIIEINISLIQECSSYS